MFQILVEEIRLEARTKAQQYYGRMMSDPEQRRSAKSDPQERAAVKRQAKWQARTVKKQQMARGHKPGYIKKLRSMDKDHDPNLGRDIRLQRKLAKKSQRKDQLAKMAKMDPRRRRSMRRSKARGYRDDD